MATICAYLLRKLETFALIQKQQIIWQENYKGYLPFAIRTSIMLKNSKSQPAIKELKPGAIQPVTKFD